MKEEQAKAHHEASKDVHSITHEHEHEHEHHEHGHGHGREETLGDKQVPRPSLCVMLLSQDTSWLRASLFLVQVLARSPTLGLATVVILCVFPLFL